jgi:hypothetical protein
MDAIEILELDHQETRQAMQEIQKCRESDRKAKFSAFWSATKIHDEIEESIFFGSIKIGAAAMRILEKVAGAHRVVEAAMAHLAELPTDNPRWIIIFRSLEEKLLGHMDEEDTVIFVRIRQLMLQKDLEDIADEMRAERMNQFKMA